MMYQEVCAYSSAKIEYDVSECIKYTRLSWNGQLGTTLLFLFLMLVPSHAANRPLLDVLDVH